MKNGLVSTTEKSLKDAVVSLRKDMIDVTSRIKDLEERLNQLTRLQNKEEVIILTISNDFITFIVLVFLINDLSNTLLTFLQNNGESFIHDEENREFLMEVMQGHIPRELVREARGGEVI